MGQIPAPPPPKPPEAVYGDGRREFDRHGRFLDYNSGGIALTTDADDDDRCRYCMVPFDDGVTQCTHCGAARSR